MAMVVCPFAWRNTSSHSPRWGREWCERSNRWHWVATLWLFLWVHGICWDTIFISAYFCSGYHTRNQTAMYNVHSVHGDAYMSQWIGQALVHIVACRLVGVKPYLNQCWHLVYWTLGNKLHWNLNRNKKKLFVNENAFEIVVRDMVTILSRGKWVDSLFRLTNTRVTYTMYVMPFWEKSVVISC